jgi:ABC-2 type transport system ATP-binding protein
MTERWRWVLRDVDFKVEPGEAVGLVGANGSGKSTLLKILTRVMYPYAGRLEVTGRVGALIEIKAGIHPDLTGRENIHLYGSLLGLKRAEVTRRFDEIVEFAELTDAIDRQLKWYSSGMSMRLGFGVAAFLNPDILLVDEVLAVGDAAFQQKCLNRMRVVLAEGTTLVYVSHDLATVEATCTRGVWLDYGDIRADGSVRQSLGAYRHEIETLAEAQVADGAVKLTEAVATGLDGHPIRSHEPLEVTLRVKAADRTHGSLCIGVTEGPAAPVFLLRNDLDLAPGETEARCSITSLPLPRGRYFLWVGLFDGRGVDLMAWHPAASFEVEGPELDVSPPGVMRLAPVYVNARWDRR